VISSILKAVSGPEPEDPAFEDGNRRESSVGIDVVERLTMRNFLSVMLLTLAFGAGVTDRSVEAASYGRRGRQSLLPARSGLRGAHRVPTAALHRAQAGTRNGLCSTAGRHDSRCGRDRDAASDCHLDPNDPGTAIQGRGLTRFQKPVYRTVMRETTLYGFSDRCPRTIWKDVAYTVQKPVRETHF